MEKNNNPQFLIEEGVLKKYNGPGGEVSVPAGVTAIGSKAFMECDSLTRVKLPEGVTSVGEQAFMYCQNLRSMLVNLRRFQLFSRIRIDLLFLHHLEIKRTK